MSNLEPDDTIDLVQDGSQLTFTTDSAGDWSEPEPAAGTDTEDSGDVDNRPHPIIEPFDPTHIRVRSQTMTVDLLLSRIFHKEIVLHPDFQRNEVWSDVARSRLIESALIRIPLPALYMDATDEDRWLVIDGLQRLSTFHRFVTEQTFSLSGLEFLSDFENRKYDELPRTFQRRIGETQMDVYLIDKGTPPAVKYNIFKRINTGGMPLSPQEIRHALNQGPATDLLARLASSQGFLAATQGSVKPKRMDDREAVLRALAFLITPYTQYPSNGDFDAFLNDALAQLNSMTDDQRAHLEASFSRSMRAANQIFGREAFRKMYLPHQSRPPVNKALFEAWAVVLAKCTEAQIAELVQNRESLRNKSRDKTRGDYEFFTAISAATGDKRKVVRRFEVVESIVQEVLR